MIQVHPVPKILIEPTGPLAFSFSEEASQT